LLAWGNRHFAPEGASVQLIDKATGAASDPILVDRITGRPITQIDHTLAAGPAAPARTRSRYASVRGDALPAEQSPAASRKRIARRKNPARQERR
jgi:hypothetical protein